MGFFSSGIHKIEFSLICVPTIIKSMCSLRANGFILENISIKIVFASTRFQERSMKTFNFLHLLTKKMLLRSKEGMYVYNFECTKYRAN